VIVTEIESEAACSADRDRTVSGALAKAANAESAAEV
jgi:hypothetical protein